jgi:phage tail-like protein
MASTTRRDPFPAFCFRVKLTSVGGTVDSFFKSVSGLRSETEVIPVRAGGVNDTTFNLPGAVKWPPLVFKQGFTTDTTLMKWRQDWMKGTTFTRTDGSIFQLNTHLDVVGQWDFVQGWPSKWEIGEFDAAKNELQIETLEIVHDGLIWAK